MIPSHAPPYYFPNLSITEYLQSFYCWYIGSFDNRKIQVIFHRLISLSQEDILSLQCTKILTEEFNILADEIRFTSVSLFSFEQTLLRIEDRITQNNPKAKLLSLLILIKSKEETSPFLSFLSHLDPKKLDRFMSHAAAQLLTVYLKNPSSPTPLHELQTLFHSWKKY